MHTCQQDVGAVAAAVAGEVATPPEPGTGAARAQAVHPGRTTSTNTSIDIVQQNSSGKPPLKRKVRVKLANDARSASMLPEGAWVERFKNSFATESQNRAASENPKKRQRRLRVRVSSTASLS